jgi:hypothetical protein
MGYLMEVPVEAGGRLVVEVSEDDLPGSLELAARGPGEVVARAGQSLEGALDSLRPVVRTVREKLAEMSPDETTVEFGLLIGGETGIVVAKGTAEVHFTVTMSWKGAPAQARDPHAARPRR